MARFLCVLLISKCLPRSNTSYFWTKLERPRLPAMDMSFRPRLDAFLPLVITQPKSWAPRIHLLRARTALLDITRQLYLFYCCPPTLSSFLALGPRGTWVLLLSYEMRCDGRMGKSMLGLAEEPLNLNWAQKHGLHCGVSTIREGEKVMVFHVKSLS